MAVTEATEFIQARDSGVATHSGRGSIVLRLTVELVVEWVIRDGMGHFLAARSVHLGSSFFFVFCFFVIC